MSFPDFLTVLWKRRYLMLSCIVMVNLATIAIIKFVPPVFEASVLILFNDSKSAQLDASRAQGGANSRREQAVQSEVMIAQSEAVIARAVELSETVQHLRMTRPQIFRDDIPPNRQAELFVLGNLKVTIEPNTDLIKLSYRDTNPLYAAKVANAVAASLRERHLTLSTNPETTDFFRNQERHYEKELGDAAAMLRAYEAKNAVFSIKEERRLALERRDSIAKGLATTRGAIQRIDSEINSIKVQVAALRKRINLPPEIFGPSTTAAQDEAATASARQLGQDPSLLHVRIYQDTAQKLVTSNAELAGMRALEASQVADLKEIEERLLKLSAKDEEYGSLNRKVSAAEGYLEILRRKGAEADIDNAWRSNDRLSSLQVVQPAVQPLRPSFPRASLLVPLGALASLILAMLAALAIETISRHHMANLTIVGEFKQDQTAHARIPVRS